MYALIYDEHIPENPQKKVFSIHESLEKAEIDLEARKKEPGRTVYESNIRIVWIEKEVKPGDTVGPAEYDTWRLVG